MFTDEVCDALFAQGLIACLPLERPIDELLEVGDALMASPVFVVALGAGSGATSAALAEFRARYGRNMLVGGWRVRTPAECRLVLAGGAQFVIGEPLTAIADLCANNGVFYLPMVPSLPQGQNGRQLAALACPVSLPPDALASLPTPLLLTGAESMADVSVAAQIRRARAHARLCTALALAPPVVDIHSTPHALITELRLLRSLWEGAPLPS